MSGELGIDDDIFRNFTVAKIENLPINIWRSAGRVRSTTLGIGLPKDLQREFGPIANDEVDRLGRDVSGVDLKEMFWREYIERTAPWQGFETESLKEYEEALDTSCKFG